MISGIGGGGGGYAPPQSISDIKADLTAKFNEFDVDGDGALSKSELLTGASEDGRSVEGAEAIFELVDTDNDGIVTLEEHESGLEKLAEGGGQGRPPGPPPNQSINQSDFDLTALLLQSLQGQEDDSTNSTSINSILEQLGSN